MGRRVALLLLLGSLSAHGQLPNDFQKPAKLLVITDPPGATIWLRTVGAKNHLSALGTTQSSANSPNVVTVELGGSADFYEFHIGGPQEPQGGLPGPYYGYAPYKLDIPKASIRGGSYVSPKITLEPAAGFANQLARLAIWPRLHPYLSGFLGALGFGAVFFLVTTVWPRRKAWMEERQKVARFNERLRNLDVQNDVFLGRQFGEWATMKRLGQGGMATVYKGVSIHTMDEESAVAIKVMNPELNQDLDYRRRFNREIQICTSLDHPNVVRTINWGEQEGILYLAMEYIEGETLRDKLPAKGYALPEALPLALGIVQGLIHAHNKGVVHRDLKPDNVMVTRGGLVKVMDLGLAKQEESDNVTQTGDTFGTPAYMAPEQINGGALTPATDQYAFGVMLFEIVTGHRPFEVADSLTLVMKHLQEPPPRIREYKAQLPQELDELIDRMLVKDPTKRYRNLAEVQVELSKIQRKYAPE